MKKLVIGFFLAGISLLALVGSIYWYNATFTSSNWMNQMMGSMMGRDTQSIASPSYMFLLPLLLFIPLSAGVVMLGYFSLYPEIRTGSPPVAYQPASVNSSPSFETILKTMKPEEKRVLEILKAHNGVYLQKNIRQESGLTRLKVHRIIARLAERGIINVKEQGNTNEIILGDWLRN